MSFLRAHYFLQLLKLEQIMCPQKNEFWPLNMIFVLLMKNELNYIDSVMVFECQFSMSSQQKWLKLSETTNLSN